MAQPWVKYLIWCSRDEIISRSYTERNKYSMYFMHVCGIIFKFCGRPARPRRTCEKSYFFPTAFTLSKIAVFIKTDILKYVTAGTYRKTNLEANVSNDFQMKGSWIWLSMLSHRSTWIQSRVLRKWAFGHMQTASFRRACGSAQSRQNLCCLPWVISRSTACESKQQSFRQDCTDAQARLKLCC